MLDNNDAELIERELNKALNSVDYEPLLGPCRDIIARGGKRWRPRLMLLVAGHYGRRDTVLPLVPLVEFSHNASLIHDDIEDQSVERRGKPALQLIYGEDTAINSGSFLYFFAGRSLKHIKASDAEKLRCFNTWLEYMCQLHLGQALDIKWHNTPLSQFIPSLEEYTRMCRLKTGSLAALAVNLALPQSIEEHDEAKGLLEAAMDLGLGFQIIDDVKNLEGGIKGKARADDLVEGKRSLPLIIYLKEKHGDISLVESAFKAAREQGTNADDAQGLIEAMRDSIAEARGIGESCFARARIAFASMPDVQDLISYLRGV